MIKFITDFNGRTNRKDYWLKCVLPIIALQFGIFAGLIFLSGFVPITYETAQLIINGSNLALTAATLAPTVRRYHDIGLSGYTLVGFGVAFFTVNYVFKSAMHSGTDGIAIMSFLLLVAATILQFYLLGLRPGQDGENEFGPDPRKARNTPAAEVFA